MKTIYLDCASGVSGDMMLAALVDAGADLDRIQEGVQSLGLPHVQLKRSEVKRHAFRAVKVDVEHPPEHAHRHLHHITEMIQGSRLTTAQQELACRIFTRLGEAEAKVHGTTLQKVHFHEVGAVDSIADIVGVAIGLDLLQAEAIGCSPVPTGSGTIEIAHGRCSVPAPATAELLRGVPLAVGGVEAELTTPTGAAIVASIVDRFGALPSMTIETIGYGAGTNDFAEQANILRLIVGQSTESATRDRQDQIVVIETNLDDVTGEVIGYTSQQLWDAGALDVYTTPIQMKKNRPGTKLTVLCASNGVDIAESILFRETQTLGVRRWKADRTKLVREEATIDTKWGQVKAKRVVLPNGDSIVQPEYEDCRALAEQHHVSLQQVMQAARQNASERR